MAVAGYIGKRLLGNAKQGLFDCEGLVPVAFYLQVSGNTCLISPLRNEFFERYNKAFAFQGHRS